VTDKPLDNSPLGRLRGWYERLIGSPPAQPLPAHAPAASDVGVPDHIGHYSVLRRLGQGGMGVVYEARDERLGRTIALKTMTLVPDDAARSRFWREARVAASVNHPNICQIYEIGEENGELFIAMELLEGESLSERLRQGALTVSDAVTVGLGILTALAALHDRGIVHRDLKPSNVFLTPHGVKLLDFGLARPVVNLSSRAADALTRSGVAVGTPKYMAPEQVVGDAVDVRADLFAAGALLFEMLAGRPAFSGGEIAEILRATLSEQPPALTGGPAVAAVDRVIRRALAKRPADRPASAKAMADELKEAGVIGGDERPVLAKALTRIVVLPFRVLRPDTEIEFLSFSLPDAIATSLSGIGPLVVRSTATAARHAGDPTPNLKAIAADADVDRAVLGTLLRSGSEVRATVQLVETPSGTLLATHTVQSSLGDLFRLQDDIARGVVEALALPLGTGSPPTPDVPRNARAYELYLRANELARTYEGVPAARDLYRECVELDSRFAPAWAHLGRCERIIKKYIDSTQTHDGAAQEALKRALTLNPRLSVAHKFLAQLEADGGQAQRAMIRLVEEANRRGNDPDLFAGLVHACRYCGLYEESIAAHAEARRLDPHIPTSLEQTLMMTGDLERLLAIERPATVAGADDGIRIMALGLAGRRDEAIRLLADMRQGPRIPAFREWADLLRAWLERRPDEMLDRLSSFSALKIQDDPEAALIEGWLLCDAGAHEAGLGHVHRATSKGYFAFDVLSQREHFAPLRGDRDFQSVLTAAEHGREQARAAFRAADGERLLGVRHADPR
jgi:serine/threonine protein kinase/tetratricopeptide (TPR) repeat protein